MFHPNDAFVKRMPDMVPSTEKASYDGETVNTYEVSQNWVQDPGPQKQSKYYTQQQF